MFKKLFRKKNTHEIIQVQSHEIEFLGSPYGDDAIRLENDISERLRTVPAVSDAYLVMMHYVAEEPVRLALIITSSDSKVKTTPIIAAACSGVTQMEIMFMEDLGDENRKHITETCKKFYDLGAD